MLFAKNGRKDSLTIEGARVLDPVEGIDECLTVTIENGARHALIGPNGAGKTTFINLLTGYLRPTSGEIYLGPQPVTGLSQHARVKMGMTRTFQITSLFPGLTVLESVVMAVCERTDRGGAWWRATAAETSAIDEARAILATL